MSVFFCSARSSGVFTRAVASLFLAMLCVAAQAQDNKSGLGKKQDGSDSPGSSQATKSDSDTDQLTDGLLDLLNEPEPSRGGTNEKMPDVSPEEVGLDGEDLGEQPNDPLASVRQSMVIAAEFLNRGVTGGTTQTLQGDIVERLDDVIKQIEKAQEDASQQSTQGENSQAAGQESQSQESTSERSRTKQAESNQNSKDQSTGRETPGQEGKKKELRTDLVDPGKLQLEVWGQLPERIRKQMQSRMVEQFLPSYRDQIQAYFESLLRERGR